MYEVEVEVCTACNGAKVPKVTVRTQSEWEEEGCPFSSIECQHCGGSGLEP